MDFAGRKVLVVGLGASGYSAARALADLGAAVSVTEGFAGSMIEERAAELRERGIAVEVGGHDFDSMVADLAIVSPGIPPSAPVMVTLTERAIPIWSEVELAFRIARCDFLAVTGTNGKTTTTTLLAAILEEAGIKTVAAGNIGLPLIDAVQSMPPGAAIATEVSSFQLAYIDAFHPRVAVVLNVAEDHTDWHGDFDAYVSAKARIADNQKPDDYLVLNADDPIVARLGESAVATIVPFSTKTSPPDGAGIANDRLEWLGEPFISAGDVPLRGVAGLEDTLAAAAAALAYGVDPRAVARAVKSFRALPHRLELVAQAGGISFIDDSKATNPHATLSAVKGMTDVVLIAGGRSKGMDLSALAGTVPPVRAVVAIGEARDEVAEVFSGLVPVSLCASMEEAVRRAADAVVPGGSVLLAPGCASLDMYPSYAARGEDFSRCVGLVLEKRPGGGGDGNAQ
ncbi:MAG TPA: UDP-N-acetylmuramoyl-L-alanine--D-glutamate ligase [Actinomycetota bacterium]|nr:UDP-N-acetylmuramoyl-L-alanine--D-glutamate ligase [Actinomycetota bacterium]